VLSRPAPPPDAVLRYGDAPEQVADLRLPRREPAGADTHPPAQSPVPSPAQSRAQSSGRVPEPAPILVLLHGGFWRQEYDRVHLGPLATALAASGYVVCVPEFRRATQTRSGWPCIFDDIAAAVEQVPRLAARAALAARTRDIRGGSRVDPGPVLLAGHSAGGHLALWAAARRRLPVGTPWRHTAQIPVRAVIGLAAVSDLRACHDERLGDDAATHLIGGSPQELPDRYAVTDPARLLPLGVPIMLVHGADDDRVPARMSRDFAARARAAGDNVALRELSGCEHFGLIDPLSAAWPQVLAAFAAAAGVKRGVNGCGVHWGGGGQVSDGGG
jgi:acetyl esterase/lipase